MPRDVLSCRDDMSYRHVVCWSVELDMRLILCNVGWWSVVCWVLAGMDTKVSLGWGIRIRHIFMQIFMLEMNPWSKRNLVFFLCPKPITHQTNAVIHPYTGTSKYHRSHLYTNQPSENITTYHDTPSTQSTHQQTSALQHSNTIINRSRSSHTTHQQHT